MNHWVHTFAWSVLLPERVAQFLPVFSYFYPLCWYTRNDCREAFFPFVWSGVRVFCTQLSYHWKIVVLNLNIYLWPWNIFIEVILKLYLSLPTSLIIDYGKLGVIMIKVSVVRCVKFKFEDIILRTWEPFRAFWTTFMLINWDTFL